MSDLSRRLAMENPEYHTTSKEVEALNAKIASQHADISSLYRTVESLRSSLRELVGLLDGADAQNALQRAKDLLP